MSANSSLLEHERVFNDLVQSLSAIGKVIDSHELIVLYANSLLTKTFGTWIQSQMAFIDTMTQSSKDASEKKHVASTPVD